MARSSSLRSRGRGYGERVVDKRDPIQRFLIVCEGEKTEPNYFRPSTTVHLLVQGLNRFVRWSPRRRTPGDDLDLCPARFTGGAQIETRRHGR